VTGYLILAAATGIAWVNPMTGLILVYVSRIIDGFSGGNISTAQAYVSDVTPPKDRAKAMGILGAAFGIGFSIGPGLGGLLGHFHRSLPALAAALFSGVAAIMTIVRLREPARHSRDSDEEMLLWLHPARFLPILRNRTLVQMLGISFLTMSAFVMLESVFAIFLNDRFGFQELQVGGFFAFVGLIIIVVQGGLVGRLTKKFGEWNLVITGAIVVALAMAIYVMVGSNPSITVAGGVVLILLAGLFNATGRSIQTPTLSALISQHADPRRQGTTFGLYHMLSSLARVIGPIVATALYARHITGPFALAGALVLAVAGWTMILRTRAAQTRDNSIDAIPQPSAGHE
jgi:MFS family permease